VATPWRTRASRTCYDSPWFRLREDEVELPSGETITYTLVDHPGYALVVPLLEDGRVLLERVYRYTVQDVVLECPAGGLDGEPPEIAAARELEEETGWVADALQPLGSFYGSNGISNEVGHFFLATGLRPEGRAQREATEQLELELLPFEQALARALDGRIVDAPSALALVRAGWVTGALHRVLAERPC